MYADYLPIFNTILKWLQNLGDLTYRKIMSSQCFIMNINGLVSQNPSLDNNDTEAKPPLSKEKVMSYEEKSVGSTAFFKCEACPYMAFAEDDIKFHLFTVHPDLAKSNGLANNIQIPCPGCTDIFDAEETLRSHLRNHHKMGIKDVKKMVKSLIQIALKNATLKKDKKTDNPLPLNDMKMPELIEIAPDMVINGDSLPKGVAFISVDELQKMSTPNFEKVDPKEIIQEASINIVYSNDLSNQYLNNVPLSSSCNVIQMSSVTPDLISSVQPRVPQILENSNLTSSQGTFESKDSIPNMLPVSKSVKVQSQLCTYDIKEPVQNIEEEKKSCSIDGCHVRLKDDEKLTYHRKCHKNGSIQCPECAKMFSNFDNLHTHLWKIHAIDLELPTCEICGYKTFKKYRLYNIHMKCHGNIKAYTCAVCSKSFKNTHQLSKHKMVHKRDSDPVQCSICQREFSNERRMKMHMAAVHDKLKPYKCCHCDYTAARKEELKLHSRSHTGDKPYSCDHCSYRSADHNAMRRHKKIHSKENVYKCKYCPYTAIQSTIFASHMISKHPNINSDDIHRCPYCPFKSVSKDKYVVHLRSHTDQEGVKILIEMTKGTKPNKPSWTIPSETDEKKPEEATKILDDVDKQPSSKTVKEIPIEVYDCDSLSESIPQSYSKSYCTTPSNLEQTNYNKDVTDLSKLDNNSDCVNSESSSDILESHQYTSQNSLQNINYNKSQPNIHGFLNTSAPINQNLLPNNTICTIATNHSLTTNISSNIMNNFPIRLPLAPQLSVRNNITLKPVDKISLPVSKVTGPIIKPTQILPVPSSSKSPISIPIEIEGIPRKKPKISVKSNLILKGPDQVNMFHSQQQLAFKRLEDNERFGLGRTVSFNNLIKTQFMQLQTEPALSESPTDIMAYQQEAMLVESATTPEDSSMSDSSQIFSFNQQMDVNSIDMLPPAQKIQSDDPSYIKLEATIKQNTQSPSLERMCNANLLNNQDVNQEYKASPPPPIVKSFYDLALNNTLNGEHLCEHKVNNPSIIDQYLLDNMIGDQYTTHIDLSSVVLPEVSDDQQNDVIEIDDNSDDNKLLPRFDMNFPLESLYLMQNDFHFLESEIATSNTATEVEVPIINQMEPLNIVPAEGPSNDFPNFIEGKKDPMMNTSVRPTTNKINVKNIELMKN